MPALPQEAADAWEHKKGPVILTTVDGQGIPNSIYATCVAQFDPETLVVANNYFSKTQANIQAGGQASLLFITGENAAYQVKGTIEYHTQGPVFDHMKGWNPEKHPGHGAAALKVESVFKGAEQLL
ncbi:MAG: pyridoxamine 5'-phosphate oxidase family protein [Desulfobacterales bacterium]|nr:pyridoxamine 5'-phosphate oxidase family protein [Desulfobacterales bacterium]